MVTSEFPPTSKLLKINVLKFFNSVNMKALRLTVGLKKPYLAEKRLINASLDFCLKKVQKDDMIICSELSRLGRSLYMVLNILSLCMEKGVAVRSIKDNFTLGDDIQSKVLAFAFGLSAEIERKMVSERTKQGLALRREQGVVLGRPKGSKNSNNKLIPHQDVIKTLIEQDNTYAEVARLFHVNRSTMKRFCDEYDIKRPFNRNKKSMDFIVVNKEPVSDNNNEQTVNNLLTIKI